MAALHVRNAVCGKSASIWIYILPVFQEENVKNKKRAVFASSVPYVGLPAPLLLWLRSCVQRALAAKGAR